MKIILRKFSIISMI